MKVSQEVAARFSELRKEASDLLVHTSTLPNRELQDISRRFRRTLARLESALFPAGGAVASDPLTDDAEPEEEVSLATVLEELREIRFTIGIIKRDLIASGDST